MSPDEINRAIAESVGFQFIPCHDDGFGVATGERWLDPEGDIAFDIPNYHGDLNACAKFERALRGTDEVFYNDPYRNRRYNAYQYLLMSRFGASATAPQRCEFYLRAIGKWRDE